MSNQNINNKKTDDDHGAEIETSVSVVVGDKAEVEDSKTINPPIEFREEIHGDFHTLLKNMGKLKTVITALQNELRTLDRKVIKKMNVYEKQRKKYERRGNKRPSGFATPSKISPTLCEFMKRPPDTKVARTEVTKYIINYIKEKDLQWPENRRVIKPDKALGDLLVNGDEQVTYFNIQRFMNKHFIKKEKLETVSVTATE